jgi:hypothetical protein
VVSFSGVEVDGGSGGSGVAWQCFTAPTTE